MASHGKGAGVDCHEFSPSAMRNKVWIPNQFPLSESVLLL